MRRTLQASLVNSKGGVGGKWFFYRYLARGEKERKEVKKSAKMPH